MNLSKPTRTLSVMGRRAIRSQHFRLDLGLRDLWPQWKSLFNPQYLKEDVTAGLTVACIAIPLSFAIALASGVKPEAGLVTAIVAGIVCALFGGTPLSVSGPAAAMSVLIASNVEQFGVTGVVVMGLMCGLMQIVTGFFGLGSIARFVPAPVIAGFTAGIGVIILVGQLPRALGLPPPDQSHVIEVIKHLIELITHMQPMVFVLTLGTLYIMIRLPKIFPKVPAPLVAVVVPTFTVWMFQLDVPVIGDIPRSLPTPKFPSIPGDFSALLAAASIVYVLASLETLLSSSAVDRLSKSGRHDPDQELIGQGLGNIAVSLFGGIPVTGVIARSALNIQAGAKTRRSAIIHSLALLSVVFVFAPVMSRIPIAALAGVLLSVAINMLSPKEFIAIWEGSRVDALIYSVTLAVVVLTDLIVGVKAGIGIALFVAAIRMGQTKVQFHNASGTGPYRFTLSGSLSFLAANRLDSIRRNLSGFEPSRGVVIDLARVPEADTSGASGLLELVRELGQKNARVVLKNVSPSVEHTLLAIDESGQIADRFAVTESDVFSLLGHERGAAARSRIISGVDRFQRESNGGLSHLFERLADNQEPHTLFITCSDSRLIPQLYTSSEPGELFVVRNVGNYIPEDGTDGVPAEGAAIEFSVGVLGVSQIIVCGHSSCGAIKTCLSSDPLYRFPNVSLWLKGIREGLKKGPAFKSVDEAARLNVLQQLDHLMTYQLVRDKVRNGTLRLSGWFFDVSKGEFSEYSEGDKSFVAINSLKHLDMEQKAEAATASGE